MTIPAGAIVGDGLFFENQILTAKGLGAFGECTMRDGIVSGCTVSVSSMSATIGEGYIVIGGRLFHIDQQTINFSTAVSGSYPYYSICASVKTDEDSTTSSFKQAYLWAGYGSSISAAVLPPETSVNLNLSGTTRSAWLVAFYVSSGSIAFFNGSYNYAVPPSMILLWKNPTIGNQDGPYLDAGSIVLPALTAYDGLWIVFQQNQSSQNRGSMLCVYNAAGTDSSYDVTYDLVHCNVNQSTGAVEHRGRKVTISPYLRTVTFTTGRSSSTNANTIATPTHIYGLRLTRYM